MIDQESNVETTSKSERTDVFLNRLEVMKNIDLGRDDESEIRSMK
jgi:hypothetical protein